jgi:hypothetical protein
LSDHLIFKKPPSVGGGTYLAWFKRYNRLSKDSAWVPKSREAMIDRSMTRLMLLQLGAA